MCTTIYTPYNQLVDIQGISVNVNGQVYFYHLHVHVSVKSYWLKMTLLLSFKRRKIIYWEIPSVLIKIF